MYFQGNTNISIYDSYDKRKRMEELLLTFPTVITVKQYQF